MFKINRLKKYLKKYPEIFKRVVDNNIVKVSIENNTIKIYKHNQNKISEEIIKLPNINDNTITSEEIIIENIKLSEITEKVIRVYKKVNNSYTLTLLKSTLSIKLDNFYQEPIILQIEEDKTYLNNRDISILFIKHNTIEEKYNFYKKHISNSKELNPNQINNKDKEYQSKTNIQIKLENKLKRYLKEELRYLAPLENRNLDDLIKIIKMISNRKYN